MALNRNSLIYSSLDKLINITMTIESPYETTLQWLSTTWSTIRKMSLIYQSYSNHRLLNIFLDLEVALTIKSSQIWVFYYEKDGTIFLDIEEEDFAKVMKNEAQKNHLANGVTKLIITPRSEEVPNGIPFKKLLFYCESIKIIKKEDNFGTFGIWELNPVLLFDCFTVCPNIEIFEHFQTDDRRAFSKYILGVKYNELKNVKKSMKNNKPSWIKLKSIAMVIGFDDNDELDKCVHNLCLIILKDFQNPYPRFTEHEEMSQRALVPLLKTRKGKKCIPAMRNKFRTILIDHCCHFFITGLNNRKIIVDVNMGESELNKYLKIFKKLYCRVPENQVYFSVSDNDDCCIKSNCYEDHFDLIQKKYSFILKFALICKFNWLADFGLYKLRALAALISQATNIQILNFRIDCEIDIDKSLLPVCLAPLPCLKLETGCWNGYHEKIECCFKMFPNVENLILNFSKGYGGNIIFDESNFGFIQHMKNLKSFYVKFDICAVNNWIDFLVSMSDKIDKNVKLYFSLPQFDTLIHELPYLRNSGWHLYFN